nr:PD40 domain-containing protein [Bacteroidota bacterium]
MKRYFIPLLVFSGILHAQLTVSSVRSLPIAKTEQWSNAQFSPDGRSVFLTNTEMNGIWEYSLTNNTLRVITSDRYSGYGFTVSPSGSQLAYRTTIQEHTAKGPRVQRSVVIELKTLEKRVLQEGSSVDLPFFAGNDQVVTQRSLSSSSITSQTGNLIIGTDEQGILLLKNGVSVSLDPLNGGRYIWPVLSPDGKRLAAVDMNRGAFISDADGNNAVRIGRCNAPQWSYDNRWVIGMNDIDDGHVIIGSEIIAVSADGKRKVVLTETPSVIELFPTVNPKKNEFIATTTAGDLL